MVSDQISCALHIGGVRIALFECWTRTTDNPIVGLAHFAHTSSNHSSFPGFLPFLFPLHLCSLQLLAFDTKYLGERMARDTRNFKATPVEDYRRKIGLFISLTVFLLNALTYCNAWNVWHKIRPLQLVFFFSLFRAPWQESGSEGSEASKTQNGKSTEFRKIFAGRNSNLSQHLAIQHYAWLIHCRRVVLEN